jgi:hypothetical protein
MLLISNITEKMNWSKAIYLCNSPSFNWKMGLIDFYFMLVIQLVGNVIELPPYSGVKGIF